MLLNVIVYADKLYYLPGLFVGLSYKKQLKYMFTCPKMMYLYISKYFKLIVCAHVNLLRMIKWKIVGFL